MLGLHLVVKCAITLKKVALSAEHTSAHPNTAPRCIAHTLSEYTIPVLIYPRSFCVGWSSKCVQAIKPHQIGGVRFMWENIVESLAELDSGPGLGCILAHAMGLGKTLQTVAFIQTFLLQTNNPHRRVLVLVPVNTLENWADEFKLWAPPPDDVQVWPLNEQTKSWKSRFSLISQWTKVGGVLLMGYGISFHDHLSPTRVHLQLLAHEDPPPSPQLN